MLWIVLAVIGLFVLGVKGFLWLLVFMITAAVVIALVMPKPHKNQSTQSTTAEFVWPELDEYGTHVVGESHYQPALRAIASGQQNDYEAIQVRAVLIPDDDNPYDKNAVRVEISGMQVGHLSREDAKRYRALEKKGYGMVPAECAAAITGGFTMDNGQKASFGVIVCIPPLEED